MQKDSVAAIVVTYNRFELLRECIEALRAQTRKPDEIIVVDNGCTDGTSAWLDEQKDLTIIRQANLGSSGGQYNGIKAAYQKGHQWFWCMDDDTIPRAECLAAMVRTPYFHDEWTGFLSSVVVWTDGTPHAMNSHNAEWTGHWCTTVLNDKSVRVRFSSFVSVCFSRAAVEKVGLPLKDMFIWLDDVEYTERVTRFFKGYVVLDSIAMHKTKQNENSVPDRVTPAIKTKYNFGLRNRIMWLRRRDISRMKRWALLMSVSATAIGMVLRGRAPIGSLGWLMKGFVYNPPVEFA